MRHLAALLVSATVVVALAAPGGASAQTTSIRLAAPADCLTNATCGLGLRRIYGARVDDALVRLQVADAGVSALDDGLAEVAVAFTSSPDLSRPDVVVLHDDRGMLEPDHVVPVVRRALLRAYGAAAADIRRRLDAASALISTRELRSLNQQVADGRLAEAVGGEFVDANGLGDGAVRRPGPRIVVGHQDFAENETLAYLYAAALRAGGYRVAVRSVGGFRRRALARLRSGHVAVVPEYARSLLGYLRRAPQRRSRIVGALRAALARRGLTAAHFAPGEDRNVFVMKRDASRALGVTTLSQLARHWPSAR